jgi:ABC-type branched-subunit amino acid transport system substrate-binding protein
MKQRSFLFRIVYYSYVLLVATASSQTYTYDYYDALLRDDDNLHQHPLSNLWFYNGDNEFRLGRVEALLALTGGKDNPPLHLGMHNDAAAALLAVREFNTKRHNIPNAPNCSVKLSLELRDTQSSRLEATRLLNTNTQNDPIVAIVGDYSSSITTPLAILSGHAKIPHISPAATALEFDNPGQFPLFGRISANARAEAQAARALFQNWNVTHLCVLYWRDPYGQSLANALEEQVELTEATATLNLTLNRTSLSNETKLEWAMERIRDSQYRAVYVIGPQHLFQPLLEAAKRMLGPDYLWVFSGLDLATLQEQYLIASNGTFQRQAAGIHVPSSITGFRCSQY